MSSGRVILPPVDRLAAQLPIGRQDTLPGGILCRCEHTVLEASREDLLPLLLILAATLQGNALVMPAHRLTMHIQRSQPFLLSLTNLAVSARHTHTEEIVRTY